MDIRESIKNTLNESNLTNPSKLYTPFTLFALFFSVYFKAETLGHIFLSDNWNITAQALARLGDPELKDWFLFASKVSGYSIGMLLLYGVAQFLAVGIWALSNRLNTRINAELHRGQYVAKSILEKAEIKIEQLRSDNRKLYTEIASYHTWKPEDIRRLEELLIESNEAKNNYYKINQELEEAKENISAKLKSSTSDNRVLNNDLKDIKSEFKKSKKSFEFFSFYVKYEQLIKNKKSFTFSDLVQSTECDPTQISKLLLELSNLNKPTSYSIKTEETSKIDALIFAWCTSKKMINIDTGFYSE